MWPLIICLLIGVALNAGIDSQIARSTSRPIEQVVAATIVYGYANWKLESRLQPIRAWWIGATVDSLVVGGVVFTLFYLPWAIQRERWVFRRRCSSCGYPIGGSTVCTECGGDPRSGWHVFRPGRGGRDDP